MKLQRDWIQDPQSLPFAQYIKTHALVVLVQKGLQYYDIEQSIHQVWLFPFSKIFIFIRSHQNGNPPQSKPFFGPEPERATSSPTEDASPEEGARKFRGSPRARKHGREASTANGLNLDLPLAAPAAKRSRRANNNNGNLTTKNEMAMNGDRSRSSDSMDVDQNGLGQHEPPEPVLGSRINSPAEDGQTATEGAGMDVDVDLDDDDAPAPEDPNHSAHLPRMILTNGPSVGVQSDKVVELGPETSVLSLPQKNVMHTAWSPADPSLLATSGDALCRIWNLARTSGTSGATPDGTSPFPCVDILEPGDESAVTAMAWDPSGSILAVAIRRDDADQMGEVSLWSKQGKSMDSLLATQDMILAFRWNPAGTLLLGITSSGRESSALTIWDIRSSQALPAYQLDRVLTDAAWCDDQRFIVCGHEIVAECSLDGKGSISFHSRDDQDLHQRWTYVRFDSTTCIAAIAAEDTATLAIIDANGSISTTVAHTAEITALAFEPILNRSSYTPGSPRRLATASLDGDIRIWDATNAFATLHVLNFGRSTPPMAISFTPDGYLVAAANSNRVLFWNTETGGMPKAAWRGETGKWPQQENGGMDGDSGIGEDDESCTHSLSWDADGGRLAYGLGSQVCRKYFFVPPFNLFSFKAAQSSLRFKGLLNCKYGRKLQADWRSNDRSQSSSSAHSRKAIARTPLRRLHGNASISLITFPTRPMSGLS